MSSPVKPVPMAWVQIGNMTQLLMPADDGMKLVKLLQKATECEYDYIDRGHGHGYVYALKGRALNVEFKLVQPNQIHSATSAEKSRRPGTLLLENDQ